MHDSIKVVRILGGVVEFLALGAHQIAEHGGCIIKRPGRILSLIRGHVAIRQDVFWAFRHGQDEGNVRLGRERWAVASADGILVDLLNGLACW